MKTKKVISLTLAIALFASTFLLMPNWTKAIEPGAFTDSLTDLSKIADYNLAQIGLYEVGSFAGDSTMILTGSNFDAFKNAGGQMVILPSLTWKVNAGAKVEVMGYTFDATKKFQFSWSSDGKNFVNVEDANILFDTVTIANKVDKGVDAEYKDYTSAICNLSTIAQISESARYFKVTWPVVSASYHLGLSMVRFTGGTAVTDPVYDTSNTIQNNQTNDLKDVVASTPNGFDFDQKIDNIPVLMTKYAYLIGQTAIAKPYLIYKVNDLSPVKSTFIMHDSYFKMNAEVKFYASDNPDFGWAEIVAGKQRQPSVSSSMSIMTFKIPSMPAGKNYVKIEYPQNRDFSGLPWADGTVGSVGAGDPLTYMASFQSISFNKYVAPPQIDEPIVTDTEIAMTGNSLVDAPLMADYKKSAFDFNQKLGGVYFLSLDYYYVIGKTTLPETYVTYKVKKGSPFILKSFNEETFLHMNKKFRLYSSSNMLSWNELTNVTYTNTTNTTAGNWRDETFTVPSIPSNDQYVKIVWPNEKDYTGIIDPVSNAAIGDPRHYIPALVSVRFNKSSETDADVVSTVPFMGSEVSDSANWADYKKGVFDFTQKFNGTPFLTLKYDYVLGKTVLPEIFVIYKVKSGSSFTLKSFNEDAFLHMNKKFKLYSSADMAQWSEIPDMEYFSSINASAGNWKDEIYMVSSIPATDQYVKVVWPNEKDYTGITDPVSNVVITDPRHYIPGLYSASYVKPSSLIDLNNTNPSNVTGDLTIRFTGDASRDRARMFALNTSAIDFSQVMQVGEENVPVLMLNSDFVAGKSNLPEAFISYRVKRGSPFKMIGYTHPSAFSMNLKFKLFESTNGTDWVEIQNVLYKTEPISDSNWLKETYGVNALSGNTSFIKIVWPNRQDYTGTINPLDGSILDALNYAPTLQSVTFNNPNPGTGDNGILFLLLLMLGSCACAIWMKKFTFKNRDEIG